MPIVFDMGGKDTGLIIPPFGSVSAWDADSSVAGMPIVLASVPLFFSMFYGSGEFAFHMHHVANYLVTIEESYFN